MGNPTIDVKQAINDYYKESEGGPTEPGKWQRVKTKINEWLAATRGAGKEGAEWTAGKIGEGAQWAANKLTADAANDDPNSKLKFLTALKKQLASGSQAVADYAKEHPYITSGIAAGTALTGTALAANAIRKRLASKKKKNVQASSFVLPYIKNAAEETQQEPAKEESAKEEGTQAAKKPSVLSKAVQKAWGKAKELTNKGIEQAKKHPYIAGTAAGAIGAATAYAGKKIYDRAKNKKKAQTCCTKTAAYSQYMNTMGRHSWLGNLM